MIKTLLKKWLAYFMGAFEPPTKVDFTHCDYDEPDVPMKKVGRPRKDKALRRNKEYQSLMKQRRRLEHHAKAQGNRAVDQSTEMKYLKVIRRIDEIRGEYAKV